MGCLMPFRLLKAREFKVRLGRAITVSLLFILLGYTIAFWQAVSNTEQEARARLQQVQQKVDQTLDNAQLAAITLSKDLDKPCQEVEPLLRMLLTGSPDVHSINLVHGDNIYCSSLYGPVQTHINFENYQQGKLMLMKGNELKANQPLIVYREIIGNNSVVVKLFGEHLLSELDMINMSSSMSLVVGHQRWQYNVTPTDQHFPLTTPGYLEQASPKYPLRLVTHLSTTDYLSHMRHFSQFSLLAWTFLGLVAGIWVFKRAGRMNSPGQELQRALNQREFFPYLQPVVSGEDTRWTGCEVLMRWQHPRQGMIPPDRFIPMAEDTGLIIPMTQVLMKQVCEQFAPRAHQLPKDFHFAFNISAGHCKDFSLLEDCQAFLHAFRHNPIKLVLELTERELLVADEVTDRLIAELHKLGVLIAIDDFGTGNSSLRYLQDFSIDVLKIDKSFVSMIGTDALSAHIVDNVIDLANRLGLQLVAEGVENEEQSAYLRMRHVTFLQGYLYGRPMPMTEFASQLPPLLPDVK